MSDKIRFSIPSTLDRKAVLERLNTILDPEIDESILTLGFVEAIEAEGGHLTVELQLPTHWCAPNFSYLMASGIRQELSRVPGVQSVTIRLRDHFAAEAIQSGVNSGKSFSEAFPKEGSENPEQLRDLFLRKGYLGRQERLVRHLRSAGLSFDEISALGLEDVRSDGESCWLCRRGATPVHVGPARLVQQYLERREMLGLDCSPKAPLVLGLDGIPIPPHKLEDYVTRARTARLSLEANGALCSALLQRRNMVSSQV